MRKILSLILILGIITGLSSLRILGATETIDYDLQFINNKKWDINNGNYVNDTNYMATTRHRIVENDITLNNLNFHHILFWSDNLYLGYYNTTAGGYENSKYLGDTGVNVTVPANATWFSLTAYKLAPNDIPITDLGNGTLNDRFEDTTNTLGTPLSSSQLVTNGDFSNGVTGWSNNMASTSVSGGIVTMLANGQNDEFIQTPTYTIGQKYYGVARWKATVTNVIFRIGGSSVNHNGDNQFNIKSLIHTATVTNHGLGITDQRASLWTNIELDYVYLFNISTLISNKQYSPMFNTTFDLMTDANIKLQMDSWVLSGLSTMIYVGYINLGGGVYASPLVTQIEWMLDNDAYNLEAVSVLHNYGYTPLQTYYPQYIQNINDGWSTGLTALLFYSMEASYDREEVIPDERNFLERLSDWFDDFGLGAFPKIVISLVVFIAVAVIMYLFKVSMLGILIIEFVFFVMLVVFGFFPVWIVIVVAIVLLFLIIMALAGGL